MKSLQVGQTFGPGPIVVGGWERIDTVLLVSGDEPCIDDWPRTITIATPDTCSLDPELEVWEARTTRADFDVFGLRPGACELSVALNDTELTAELVLTVTE